MVAPITSAEVTPLHADAIYMPQNKAIRIMLGDSFTFTSCRIDLERAEALQASLGRAIDAAKARPGTIPGGGA